MSNNIYPRETTEYIVVKVSLTAGDSTSVITSAVQFSLVPWVTYNVKPRPDAWVDATIVDNETAYLLTPGMAPGKYQMWTKVTDNPEIPVLDSGEVLIS